MRPCRATYLSPAPRRWHRPSRHSTCSRSSAPRLHAPGFLNQLARGFTFLRIGGSGLRALVKAVEAACRLDVAGIEQRAGTLDSGHEIGRRRSLYFGRPREAIDAVFPARRVCPRHSLPDILRRYAGKLAKLRRWIPDRTIFLVATNQPAAVQAATCDDIGLFLRTMMPACNTASTIVCASVQASEAARSRPSSFRIGSMIFADLASSMPSSAAIECVSRFSEAERQHGSMRTWRESVVIHPRQPSRYSRPSPSAARCRAPTDPPGNRRQGPCRTPRDRHFWRVCKWRAGAHSSQEGEAAWSDRTAGCPERGGSTGIHQCTPLRAVLTKPFPRMDTSAAAQAVDRRFVVPIRQ